MHGSLGVPMPACVIRVLDGAGHEAPRGTMQKIADSVTFKMPAAIDNPAFLDEIAVALKERRQLR